MVSGRRAGWWCAVSLWAGCAGQAPEDVGDGLDAEAPQSGLDAGVGADASAEARGQDAAQPSWRLLDAELDAIPQGEADVVIPDASGPDAGRVDADLPDADLPDAVGPPDVSPPDVGIPDVEVPDAFVDPCEGAVELCGNALDDDCDEVVDELTCAILEGRPEASWVAIPGGNYPMGAEGGEALEGPPRMVRVPNFFMARSEVTAGQYEACVDAGVCEALRAGANCNGGDQPERAEHPINCLTWGEAVAFAEWMGARLPSEAEWEYAARSRGRIVTYPWGDEPADCARAIIREAEDDPRGCGRDTTWPVCSRPEGETAQGICDMAGSVWEWTADVYGDYRLAPVDGRPRVEEGNDIHTLRGGSWVSGGELCRATRRLGINGNQRAIDTGFRLAVGRLRP